MDETKLDSKFRIEGHLFLPFWRDRDNVGGGKTVFAKEGLTLNRLKSLEIKVSNLRFKIYPISNLWQKEVNCFYL